MTGRLLDFFTNLDVALTAVLGQSEGSDEILLEEVMLHCCGRRKSIAILTVQDSFIACSVQVCTHKSYVLQLNSILQN